jgi:propionyl-CoA synthetase
MVDHGLRPWTWWPGVTMWSDLRAKHLNQVPCEPMQSTDISYTIYTSGTTGKPRRAA